MLNPRISTLLTCAVLATLLAAAAAPGCSDERAGGSPPVPASDWAEWPMPNVQVDVAAGAPHPMAYTVGGDGTVKDEVTGLTWQQTPTTALYNWADAARYCADLALAGHDDWRLPTEIELISIVDDTVATPPAIDAATFVGTLPGYYWSSLPMAGASGNAWQVDFITGSAYDGDVLALLNVRCVMALGAAPKGRYTIAANTVVDNKTKLTWQRFASPSAVARDESGTTCGSPSTLAELGGSGWRLPTAKELLTLVDYSVPAPGPTIDQTAFPQTPPEFFWTATPLSGGDDYVWNIDFGHGHAVNYPSGPTSYVRCVR